MHINAFLNYLSYEKKYSVHTISSYKTDLGSLKFFCNKQSTESDLSKLNYAQLRQWIVWLANKGISPRTINRKTATLKSFYKFLQKIKAIETSPMINHKPLKTEKSLQVPFSEEEMNKLIEALSCKTDFEGIRDLSMIEMLYATGIRRSELINLKLEHIDLEEQMLKVECGKGAKDRLVPLTDSSILTLKKYLAARNQLIVDVNNLYVTKKGKKIYGQLLYRVVENSLSLVSLKSKRSPHMIRHSFATHLLNNGANLNAVSKLLGHESLASTQVYTQISLGKLKKIYNQAHPRSFKNNNNMKINIQAVNFKTDQKLIDYIDKKLNSIEKFYEKVVDAEVFLKIQQTSEKENKHVEVKLNVPGNHFIVKKQTKTFEEAISQITESLKRQVEKEKEK